MRRHNQPSGGGSILPAGYTQLQYLESTGTQYITIPGYYPTTNATVTGSYRLSTALTSVFQAGKDSTRIMLFPVNSTRVDYCFGSGYKSLTVASGDSDIGTWYDFTMNYNTLVLNSHTYSITGQQNVTANIQLYLFSNNFGSGVTCRNVAIGRLTITDSSAGSIDLVPALRDSDSEPGLYDIINNAFYTNQGSGTFVYA